VLAPAFVPLAPWKVKCGTPALRVEPPARAGDGDNQRGAQPQWFIRAHWHQGPGGHLHMVTTPRPGQPAAPPASQPPAAGPSEELAHQPGQDIVAALQSLAQQVADLQADNDRLRADNDRLSAEVRHLRTGCARPAGPSPSMPASS